MAGCNEGDAEEDSALYPHSTFPSGVPALCQLAAFLHSQPLQVPRCCSLHLHPLSPNTGQFEIVMFPPPLVPPRFPLGFILNPSISQPNLLRLIPVSVCTPTPDFPRRGCVPLRQVSWSLYLCRYMLAHKHMQTPYRKATSALQYSGSLVIVLHSG